MRILLRKKTSKKVNSRLRSRARIRKKVSGTAEVPRLSVFRGLKNINIQLIDDVSGTTIASASTLGKKVNCNIEGVKVVGEELAKKALAKGISKVVFDRGGYLYHGKVKAIAEAAREAGLKF